MTAWFQPVLDACFQKSEKVPKNVFLKVFAGAMTAPWNDSYHAGRSRSPEMIRSDQIDLLKACTEAAEQWTSPERETKKRMQDLAITLTGLPGADRVGEYLNKHTSYKPGHYLSLYLGADAGTQKAVYSQVERFYALALTRICGSAVREPFLRAKELLLEKIPEFQFREGPEGDRFGQCLCALMLWHSVEAVGTDEARDLSYRLLDIDPPEPCSTQLVLSLDSVTLPMEHYISLCAAALRTELELPELTGIYRTLIWIREKMGGQSDPALHGLICAFVQALDAFGAKKARLLAQDWRGSGDAVEEMACANSMYATCQRWIG